MSVVKFTTSSLVLQTASMVRSVSQRRCEKG